MGCLLFKENLYIKLENLQFNDCKGITTKGMIEILQMCGTELKDLDVSETNISGEGLIGLKEKFANLKTLDLSNWDRITMKGMKE